MNASILKTLPSTCNDKKFMVVTLKTPQHNLEGQAPSQIHVQIYARRDHGVLECQCIQRPIMRKASDDLFNHAVTIEVYALREQYLTLHPNEASHCPQLHARNWYAATNTEHKHG